MSTAFTAAGYLDYIEGPGRGWGDGCRVVNRRTKTIGGVEFHVGTAIDNRHDERTSVYITDDGFEVTPITGTVPWSVSARHDAIRDHQRSIGHTAVGVMYASNLAQAAKYVTEVREWATSTGTSYTPRELP